MNWSGGNQRTAKWETLPLVSTVTTPSVFWQTGGQRTRARSTETDGDKWVVYRSHVVEDELLGVRDAIAGREGANCLRLAGRKANES